MTDDMSSVIGHRSSVIVHLSSFFAIFNLAMPKVIKVDYGTLTRHVFSIHKESVLQRLDIYIHKRLPEYSRTLVQKLIKEGRVTVNGHPTKPAYEINLGDEIAVDV